MNEWERAIEEFTRIKGITQCPPAAVAIGNGFDISEANRVRLREHAETLKAKPKERVEFKETVHTPEQTKQPLRSRNAPGATVSKGDGSKITRVNFGHGFLLYSEEITGRSHVSIFGRNNSFKGSIQLRGHKL